METRNLPGIEQAISHHFRELIFLQCATHARTTRGSSIQRNQSPLAQQESCGQVWAGLWNPGPNAASPHLILAKWREVMQSFSIGAGGEALVGLGVPFLAFSFLDPS